MSFDTSEYNVDSFDNAGHIVCSYSIKNGIVLWKSRSEYEFDPKGRVTEECCMYADNMDQGVIVRRIFAYDTTGNLIGQKFYAKDMLTRSIKYVYSNGLIVRKEDSSHGITETIYKYDGKGKLIEETICSLYSTDNEKLTITYAYDKAGKKVSQKWQSKSVVIISKFDEHGNEIQENDYTLEDNYIPLYTPQYIYDSHNNWIRNVVTEREMEHIVYDENEPICYYPVYHLTVRQIEYY